MPLYEYQCESCGGVFEVIQKFVDDPLTTHGACGGKVHRLLSAPALQFKGTGWYVTDYGRKNGGGDASNGKGKNGTSEAAKTESKAKTESTPASAAGSKSDSK